MYAVGTKIKQMMPESYINSGNSKQFFFEEKIQALESERDEFIFYKHFFNESKDLACVANMDGYFTKVNPAFTELLGYTETELLNVPFLNFIHPNDIQKTKDELEFMQTKGETTLKFENRYITKKGEIVYLQWNTSLDWKNKIIYAIARDYTAKKVIIDKLEQSEHLMRAAQSISKMGSWSFTLENQELYWSDELYNIFEIDRKTQNLYQDYISRFNKEDYKKLNDNIAKSIIESKPYILQHCINLPNEEKKWVLCSGNPVKDLSGKVVKLEGFVQDISNQKKIEITILNNIKEKETLLQELHHRVKNNMQVVSSLLNLQSSIIECPQIKGVIKNSQQRINAMAAIHDLLYKSNNLSHINFSCYINGLIKDLVFSYMGDDHKFDININVVEVFLTLDKAVPIGLFINEIITNSLKHGFNNKDGGQINFSLEEIKDNSYQLKISDNGNGYKIKNLAKKETLGHLLIENLADQIDGKLSHVSNKNGTSYTLIFNVNA